MLKDLAVGLLSALLALPVPAVLGTLSRRLRQAIPHALVLIAAFLTPREQRVEMRDEWTAELAQILATMPTAWQQSTAANGFAFDLIRAAARVRAATHRLTRAARREEPTVTITVNKAFRVWETKEITVPASLTRR
ncbi:hypothetical protein [Streptomyces sp. NBC_00989]|uniref:hypothetical protein n=1 Tax=Streptomyces sp. NBC_00989 TaxID=2903705 RepID=UPI00386F303F|nr:hypothetical protein OG714_00060 [Streptomyces sp. NBC_00989]WSW98155.1 hypothetical protein OG714_54080 [Streptomyces sp. NBC_00989]